VVFAGEEHEWKHYQTRHGQAGPSAPRHHSTCQHQARRGNAANGRARASQCRRGPRERCRARLWQLLGKSLPSWAGPLRCSPRPPNERRGPLAPQDGAIHAATCHALDLPPPPPPPPPALLAALPRAWRSPRRVAGGRDVARPPPAASDTGELQGHGNPHEARLSLPATPRAPALSAAWRAPA
jgi:hypothetical protein